MYNWCVQVLERALTHGDNVYKISNYRAVGRVCRTNLPPNTAFRGFGGPQGMIIAEQCMEKIIECLQLPSEQVYIISIRKYYRIVTA